MSSIPAETSGVSLWSRVRELEGDALRQIQSLYDTNFPIEFRHYFAEIIERQPWDQIDPDQASDETQAKFILDNFLGEINRQCELLSDGGDFLQRLRFSEIGQHFKNVYGNHPMELVRIVKKILSIETRLVAEASDANVNGQDDVKPSTGSDKNAKINKDLEHLYALTQDAESDLRKLQSKQEYFVINYQESVKIQTSLQQINQMSASDPTRAQLGQQLTKKKNEVDQLLQLEAHKLLQQRTSLAEKHHQTFSQLTELQNQVLDEELIQWKRSQALAYNGVIQEGSLDQLQQWCERLAEIIWQCRQQIKRVELQRQQLPINNQGVDLLPELNTTITALLSTLVTSTFIIEKQPPQVLKTQTRFGSTIRLLVGGKLNVHMNPPTVKATIVSEAQAKALLKNENSRALSETSGEILNNSSIMEYHPQSGVLSVNFRNMSLRRIKRSDKRGAESVTEEKFTILFQSQFSVGGNELVFQVRTLSLPVVVIVHGNQEANATASILWDNAFAEQGRIPFQVPDKVAWNRIIETLNYKWKHECQSAHGLTNGAMRYLSQKLFRQPLAPLSEKPVSWAQFNREPLPGRNFTFWQWFNGVMELTKSKHVQPHWLDRGCVGFICKNESQEALIQKPGGSFLLRYSDSEIGGLTIAWVSENENKTKQVWNLQPHTAKDFTVRGLADRIRDLEQLHFVYTQDERIVDKEEMFSRYYSKSPNPPSQPNDGYVKAEIQVTIPNIAGISLGSPVHESSVASPRSPSSGYGDHQSLMSSPTGPVQYEMPNQISQDQMDFSENAQQNNSGSGVAFDPQNSFDQFDSSNTIDVNELLSKVN